MASERQMWKTLAPLMAPRFHTERFEVKGATGVADVQWLHRVSRWVGWLELKCLPAWPGPRTRLGLLEVADLRQDQVVWLERWARNGGTAGVLLRIGVGNWHYWRVPREPGWLTDLRKTPGQAAIDLVTASVYGPPGEVGLDPTSLELLLLSGQ